MRSAMRARGPLVLAATAAAAIAHAAAPSAPERTIEGVARMLGEAVGGEVRADEFVWEEREGAVSDAILGRRVLFLARARANGPDAPPRDLYRARVHLARSGRPLRVTGTWNLSRTAHADEQALVAAGRWAAYRVFASSAVQGLVLVDRAGERGGGGEGRLARARLAAQRWLETGSVRGLGRLVVGFADPPAEAQLELTDRGLVMALGAERLAAAVDGDEATLVTGDRDPFGAYAEPVPAVDRGWLEIGAEAVRERFGPRAAAIVATAWSSARGAFVEVARAARTRPRLPDARGDAANEGRQTPRLETWPPPPIAAADAGTAGDVDWHAPDIELPPMPAGAAAAPYLLEAVIRPNQARPRESVHLVAIDTRRLDLRWAAGPADETPSAGPPATGVVPRAREHADRLVAAFAGGRARDRGELGLVARGRVLSPVVPELPALAANASGEIVFAASARDLLASPRATPLESLRQDASLILREGRFADGPEWGGWATDRAALGATRDGHLVYAWGDDVHADTLAGALAAAGCTEALHLGASPRRAGFAYVRAKAAEAAPGIELLASRPLAPEMIIDPAQLVASSPTETFHLVLRDPAPRAPPPEGASWAADGGAQPRPAWLPAMNEVEAIELGVRVRVVAFSPGRLRFRLRAGSREPTPKKGVAFPEVSSGDDVLAAIGTGIARAGKRRLVRGLSIGGVSVPFRGEGGVLVVSEEGVTIARAEGFSVPPDADATELPLTAEDGKLTKEARDVGTMRARAAACTLDDGTFLVATTRFDTDEATTEALLDRGCRRVVALDRGSHHAAFVQRAGTETPPLASYESTTLVATERPMRGHARSIPGPADAPAGGLPVAAPSGG